MSTEDEPPAVGMTGARFGGAPRRRRTARQRAAEAKAASAEPDDRPGADTADIPVAPATHHPGARQHGAPASGAVPPGVAAGTPAAGAPDGPVVGLTGARFGGARRQGRAPGPATGAEESSRSGPVPPGHDGVGEREAPPLPPVPDESEPVAGGSAFVRPYVLTRGRTRPTFELSIETLVSAVPQVAPGRLTGEHQVVLGLCREPRSVAELAARADVPLGVVRVLVGDLAAAGAVAVHRGAGAAGPDLALMERVLSGLRRL